MRQRVCAVRGCFVVFAAICAATMPFASSADNLIDHRLSKDTSGIYAAQDAVPISLGLLAAGCALWEGTESPLGRTCLQSGEAAIAGGLLAKGLQRAFRRQAPYETDDPNQWFSPHANGSFPSAHVMFTTAAVTPVILQYVEDEPWVAALAVLPAYEMVARVKAQEHWQTDVLAGAVLGFAVGAYEYRRNGPLVLYILPGGGFMGLKKSF